MIIIRFILIFLIVYLLVRGFIRSLFLEDHQDQNDEKRNGGSKKVSKNVGEFVDYEEVD